MAVNNLLKGLQVSGLSSSPLRQKDSSHLASARGASRCLEQTPCTYQVRSLCSLIGQ